MITPNYLNQVIAGTKVAVDRLNKRLVEDMAKHISQAFAQGNNQYYMPTVIQEMYQVAQSGYTIADVQAMIEQELPHIQTEVRAAFLASAAEIAAYNTDYAKMLVKNLEIDAKVPNYTKSGIPRIPQALNMTESEIEILKNAYERTNGTVYNITRTTAGQAYQQYIQACDDAYMLVQAGKSPGDAVAMVVEDLAKNGITTITYASGHKEYVDVAISRAVRTGVNQANSELILQRCAEMGVGYVYVSQHLGARVTKKNDWTNHSLWQGKVYKLDWTKPPLDKYGPVDVRTEPHYTFLEKIRKVLLRQDVHNYPDFVETCGYGKIDGIIGINCRHTFMAYTPGLTGKVEKQIDLKENEERYNAEQEQRRIEREMRRCNREIAALKAMNPQTDEIKAKLKEWRRNLKQWGAKYRDHCEANNLPFYYEWTR